MKEEHEKVTMEEGSAEQRRYKEKIIYQQELEKQLEDQEKNKQHAYEEFLKEKLMIDEIVRKIYEEDQMLGFLNFCYQCFSYGHIRVMCISISQTDVPTQENFPIQENCLNI